MLPELLFLLLVIITLKIVIVPVAKLIKDKIKYGRDVQVLYYPFVGPVYNFVILSI